jgi:hypothetical protein
MNHPPAEHELNHPDYDRAHKRWPEWVKERVVEVLRKTDISLEDTLPNITRTWTPHHKALACMYMRTRLGPDWHDMINGDRWWRTLDNL